MFVSCEYTPFFSGFNPISVGKIGPVQSGLPQLQIGL